MRSCTVPARIGLLLAFGSLAGCFAYAVPPPAVPLDQELGCILRSGTISIAQPTSCDGPSCAWSNYQAGSFRNYLERSRLLTVADAAQTPDVEVRVKSFAHWGTPHCPNMFTGLTLGLIPSFCSTALSGAVEFVFRRTGKIVPIEFRSEPADLVVGWVAMLMLISDEWRSTATSDQDQLELDVALSNRAAEIKAAAGVGSCNR